MKKKRVLSGMRPTGKLHLGHWVGALANWVRLQDEYDCFFMIADWHALMSEYKNPETANEIILDNVADWLACGLNPEKATIFRQSKVPQHLELFMILAAITPLGWLLRCPTFKEQIAQLKDKDVNTYAFLGYPVLQASDIVLYKANFVPVGEDQMPHLELTREIVRRFNGLYGKKIFYEPQPILTKTPRLKGLDGRKMSKSYGNYIALDEPESSLKQKIAKMFTDPARKRKQDPGCPDNCNVFFYHKLFEAGLSSEVRDFCQSAAKGCVECKKMLFDSINNFLNAKKNKKREILKDKNKINDILIQGEDKAKKAASLSLQQAREAMKF